VYCTTGLKDWPLSYPGLPTTIDLQRARVVFGSRGLMSASAWRQADKPVKNDFSGSGDAIRNCGDPFSSSFSL